MTSSGTHQHRTLSRIVVTTGAAAFAIGLLTTGSVLYSTDNASAVPTPTFSTFSRAMKTPATPEIVPSPVIDTNNEFFFGTGDGSIGCRTTQSVRASSVRLAVPGTPRDDVTSVDSVDWKNGRSLDRPFSSSSRAP